MDLNLQGRRALVTGGSRGIGRGIVVALASEGAEVLFCARDARLGATLSDEMRAAGCKVHFIEADLETAAGGDVVIESCLAGGPIDILVNNVGGVRSTERYAEFETIAIEDWEDTIQRSLLAAVRLMRGLLPAMREAGWGRVVNISSTSGLEPMAIAPPDYAAAKAAINTITMSYAHNLTGTGVTVNVVSPGPILTDMLENYMRSLARERGWGSEWPEIERRFITEITPLKTTRIGRPADVGAAVAFLASPLADYITGAHLRVDGGFSNAAI